MFLGWPTPPPSNSTRNGRLATFVPCVEDGVEQESQVLPLLLDTAFPFENDYERPLQDYIGKYPQTEHEYKTLVRDSGTLFIAFNAMWKAAGEGTVPATGAGGAARGAAHSLDEDV